MDALDFVDISANGRIPVLLDLVNSLSRITDPARVIDALLGGMRQVYRPPCFVQIGCAGMSGGRFRIMRIISPDGIDIGEVNFGGNQTPLPITGGGVFSQLIRTPVPKIVRNLNLQNDPAMGNILADYHSLMTVPIFRLGMTESWIILLDPAPEAFIPTDLEVLVLRANLVASMMSNLEVAQQLVAANTRIQKEVEHIATIQRALLPQSVPDVPGLKIAASYETFEQAGGDMYDIVPLNRHSRKHDPRWAILIGDVSGHGPSAAVMMAMFHSILHAYPHRPDGAAELLVHVNQHLCDKPIGDSFVTAFLALYDPDTRQFCYARAGHHPPLLIQTGRKAVELDAVGEIPLGVMSGVEYHDSAITLEPGQLLALYTDGIVEARSPAGGWFGVEGLIKAISGNDPQKVVSDVERAVHDHLQGTPPADDQTLVVIAVE